MDKIDNITMGQYTLVCTPKESAPCCPFEWILNIGIQSGVVSNEESSVWATVLEQARDEYILAGGSTYLQIALESSGTSNNKENKKCK